MVLLLMRRVKLLLAIPKKDSAAVCVILWVLSHETLVDRLLFTVFFALLLAKFRPMVFRVTCPFGNLVGSQSPFSPGFRSSFTLLILAKVETCMRGVKYKPNNLRAYLLLVPPAMSALPMKFFRIVSSVEYPSRSLFSLRQCP